MTSNVQLQYNAEKTLLTSLISASDAHGKTAPRKHDYQNNNELYIKRLAIWNTRMEQLIDMESECISRIAKYAERIQIVEHNECDLPALNSTTQHWIDAIRRSDGTAVEGVAVLSRMIGCGYIPTEDEVDTVLAHLRADQH